MQLARNVHPQLSSRVIRKTFIDYFCLEKSHQHIRSSPVLPFGDATLAFTNAGMNQFKPVLQGLAPPVATRVANSQKCVRVGGKHNDLALVGRDGTHHTFFEMLGNWSFGDYFKDDSCLMSWELLTKVYGLDPNRLHITYFGGDSTLGLPPDLETKEVWRKIGIPNERLVAGSARDNFWEMGESGPCGACTEIHFDTGNAGADRLLEVWNLVFVQYNRETDGTLNQLGRYHVDTGMGLERLVAILQNRSSNYDTDLFTPLFDCIHKVAKCAQYEGRYSSDGKDLDTAYRILSDHARMVTVCLADGFFPDQEGKLRGIIRKALTVSRDSFNQPSSLLKELSSVVADTLHDAYPEIGRNLKRVHHFIDHEAEILQTLRVNAKKELESLCNSDPSASRLSVAECPNLLPAYKRLRSILGNKTQNKRLDPSIAWKMCETFGVPPHLAEDLADALGMTLDMNALEMEVTMSRIQSKKDIYGEEVRKGALSPSIVQKLVESKIEATNTRPTYQYYFGFDELSTFPPQSASIVALVIDDELVEYIPGEVLSVASKIGIILDRTNMYPEGGGQSSDTGEIIAENNMVFHVFDVVNTGGYITHWVKCLKPDKEGLRVYNSALVKIDSSKRISAMRHHTATHFLNAALRQHLTVTEQKSSRVSADKLNFDFSVYRENLRLSDLEVIEKTINSVIHHDVPVKRRSVASSELASLDPLTVVPGETYPYQQVHLIEVSSGFFFSREPCCGTHVTRTSQLGDFVITNFKSISSCVKTITAVAGENATEARKNTELFNKKCKEKITEISTALNKNQCSDEEVEKYDDELNKLLKEIRETPLISFTAKTRINEKIEEIKTQLKYNARGYLRLSMESEMKKMVFENQKSYIVHLLDSSSNIDSVPLQKASKLCGDIPSLIFARSEGLVKARCCVPKAMVSDKFSAQLWLGFICQQINAQGGPPKGQNPDLVFNMKGKKLNDEQLKDVLDAARKFAENV